MVYNGFANGFSTWIADMTLASEARTVTEASNRVLNPLRVGCLFVAGSFFFGARFDFSY